MEVACKTVQELVPILHRPLVERSVLDQVEARDYATTIHVQGTGNGLHGNPGLPAVCHAHQELRVDPAPVPILLQPLVVKTAWEGVMKASPATRDLAR